MRPWAFVASEYAKLVVRSALYRANVELVRHPFASRVARLLDVADCNFVLDIGANIGQYGSGLRSNGYRGQILSCEPVSDAYRRLGRRTSSDPKWTVLRTAVGDTEGELPINVAGNYYSSSLLNATGAQLDIAPEAAGMRTEMVTVTTVQRLVREHGIEPGGALLKVDTQGYESQVMDGAGTLLKSFAAVQLELSLLSMYEGQALMPDLLARMESMGFLMYALEPGASSARTGRMLQCDGLFVRNELVRAQFARHDGAVRSPTEL